MSKSKLGISSFDLNMKFKDKKGKISSGELGIKAKNGLVLPAGVYGRYEKWYWNIIWR